MITRVKVACLPKTYSPGLCPAVYAAYAGRFEALARAYKRINAPVGELGLASLKISTAALAGDATTYKNLETRLQFITAFRDALAAEMLERLTKAEFQGKGVGGEEQVLILEANALTEAVKALAASVSGGH